MIRLEHLSEAKVRAFRIADNRLTEISIWDDRLLAEILGELSALDLDFSIEATGFSMGEIDLRIESLSAKPEDKADPADELPELPDHPAVSAAGDLWILGAPPAPVRQCARRRRLSKADGRAGGSGCVHGPSL